MTFYLVAQVSIPSDTTVPRDAAVNTLHYTTDAATPLIGATGFHNRLIAFYQAIDGLLSLVVNTPATVKSYNLADPKPRVPVHTSTIALTPSATGGMPTEVAACLSYKAAPVSGIPPSRLRGRLFIGPLDAGVATTGSGRVSLQASARTTLANAASALAGPEVADGGSWAVFSPTTAGPEPWGTGELSSAFHEVTDGFIDDAFDTQRRRGTAAQARTTWT